MDDKMLEALEVELARVGDLPLEEQPEAFSAIRDQLENVLESTPNE
jgi:hypothetical protein